MTRAERIEEAARALLTKAKASHLSPPDYIASEWWALDAILAAPPDAQGGAPVALAACDCAGTGLPCRPVPAPPPVAAPVTPDPRIEKLREWGDRYLDGKGHPHTLFWEILAPPAAPGTEAPSDGRCPNCHRGWVKVGQGMAEHCKSCKGTGRSPGQGAT